MHRPAAHLLPLVQRVADAEPARAQEERGGDWRGLVHQERAAAERIAGKEDALGRGCAMGGKRWMGGAVASGRA